MTLLQIQTDMQVLAGRLLHRCANTESEREAAEYIHQRLQSLTPDAEIDDFYSIDSPWLLFGSYYAEFTVVSLIALWWPAIALCYGAAVFLAYLAEFTGYSLMGRFAPQYETQNVVARLLAARPRRTIVIMAHYDSGKQGALEDPRVRAALPWLHVLVLLGMVTVLGTCAVEALGVSADGEFPYEVAVRWTAALCLLAAAAAVAYNAMTGESLRGANDNASGVAVLLALVERLAQAPIESADVHLVATGSNKTWMNGARRFVATHKLDKRTTLFLNIDGVGAGTLCYTTREGLVLGFPCSETLLTAARSVASRYGAEPCWLRAACADTTIPLARGYQAMSITAEDRHELRPDMHEHHDTVVRVDCGLVERAAEFAEAILRAVP